MADDDTDLDPADPLAQYREQMALALTPAQIAELRPLIVTKCVRDFLDDKIKVENASQLGTFLKAINLELSDDTMDRIEKGVAQMTAAELRDAKADLERRFRGDDETGPAAVA